ncbi:DNA topoisomerase, partial [Escherichia coli]|uniref:DNA topoisomerase n=1 Tax=Escherichia coli TaxID=562 RepID=UPI003EE1AD16
VEGIGTEATRASIIEALKQKEYIQVIKNKLVVTEKGKLLCQAVESQHEHEPSYLPLYLFLH